GHHRPGHPGELVGERDGSDLGRSPRQQPGEPGPMPGAMDPGIADHGERASREQAAQIAITLLADAAKPVLAAAGVLLRHEPDPGREVPPRSEGPGIGNTVDSAGHPHTALSPSPRRQGLRDTTLSKWLRTDRSQAR